MNTQTKLATPLTLIATLLLGACASNGVSVATPPAASNPAVASVAVKPAQVVAEVNGHAIGKSALPRPDAQKPGLEEQALDEVIARELIWQDFTAKDISKDAQTQEQLQNMLRIAYSQVAADYFMKSVTISDADLRKLYEQKKPGMVSTQFNLKHILLEDEATAKQAIAKIGKGEKFEKLAKKISKDDGSKNQGGALGWVNPRQLGPAFEHALANMSKGQVASDPIQSQFGWHIIKVEDIKTQDAPAFEAIKDKLANSAKTEKFQEHIKALKAKATITKNTASK